MRSSDRSMTDDRMPDDSDFHLSIALLIACVLFLVMWLSYRRRFSLAPRVCPVFCETLKSEYYHAWEDTSLGIRCLCEGKVRAKGKQRIAPP